MTFTFTYKNKNYQIDTDKPLDISIPVKASTPTVNAWYLDPPEITPVQNEDWIAKVSEGASVNFNMIHFNPHSHGTHTECVGHITPESRNINDSLHRFFFMAEVISIQPQQQNNDMLITRKQLEASIKSQPEALVIRTLPNTDTKKYRNYSHTNWPYIAEEAALFLRELAIDHLLIDLPSIDKEKDEGKILAHKAFWNYPEAPRTHATITELIYVSFEILDGPYLLNLQTSSFENDAAPSRPVLYEIKEV